MSLSNVLVATQLYETKNEQNQKEWHKPPNVLVFADTWRTGGGVEPFPPPAQQVLPSLLLFFQGPRSSDPPCLSLVCIIFYVFSPYMA
jgi:hypothetical protein